MTKVLCHDKHFVPYISRQEIQKRIAELGKQIDSDYADTSPIFIGILNGSFIFASDLFRATDIPAEISFIKLASYKGTASTGNVVTAIGLDDNLYNRHVIVLEDIIDTGKTLSAFLPEILQRQPASLRIASFLTKPEALQHDIKADYVGFEIPNKFVIGYGLDYDGLGRNLPDLYILSDQ
jgi:hypoxanthine phosphoribosyltransferase